MDFRKNTALRASLVVFIASMLVWLMELTLPRVYSLLFDYHFTFLSISLALSGLGLGAGVYHVWSKHERRKPVSLVLSMLLLGTATVLFLVLISTQITLLINIYVVVGLSIVPFAACGAILAHAFKAHSGKASILYAVDLAGALVAIGLYVISAPLGALFLLLLCAFVLVILIPILVRTHRQLLAWSQVVWIPILALHLLAAGTSYWQPRIALQPGQHKEMFHMQQHPGRNGEVVASEWSSFGRTDLLQSKSEPDRMVFFTDGSAGSSMFRFNGDYSDTSNTAVQMLKYFPAFSALSLIPPAEKQSALIIGPGGGRDIHLVRLAGYEKVDAVEVNGDLLNLGRTFSWFNGGIFDGALPNIKVIEAEGRGFIKRAKQNYDLIYLSIPIIKSSRSPEAFALTENFLFTTEAFDDYFSHLSERGRLVVATHDEAEVLKLVLTAKRSDYANNHLSQFYNHFYAAGAGMNPFVVFHNTALDSTLANVLHDVTMATGNFNPAGAWFPFIQAHDIQVLLSGNLPSEMPMLSEEIRGLADGTYGPDELVSASNLNLSPPRDDSPFFYNFSRDVPAVIDLAIFISGLLIVLVILWRIRSNGVRRAHSSAWGSVFIGLGLAFMLIEVPLVQRFTLFLGRPIYGLTIVLGSLLAGGVIGSLFSSKIGGSLRSLLVGSLLTVALVGAAHIFAVPMLLEVFKGEVLTTRMALATLTLAPLGIAAAIPFPTALRYAGSLGMSGEVPLYWSLNGLAAVLGAATAVAVSLSAGFAIAMSLAVVLYILAAMMSLFLRS